MNKWLEAFIVKIDNDQRTITVHYKGFTPKWDETFSFENARIAPIGRHSKAFGCGRQMRIKGIKEKADSDHSDEEDSSADIKKNKNKIRQQEEDFHKKLDEVNLRIFTIEGDGN
jgi:hypothetical protein